MNELFLIHEDDHDDVPELGDERVDQTIEELLKEIEESLKGDGETWDQMMSSHPDKLEPGNVAAYLIGDNRGYFCLTRNDVLELASRGYKADMDVLYHPSHWNPIVDLDRKDHEFHGFDGAVYAKSKAAIDWGEKKNLF